MDESVGIIGTKHPIVSRDIDGKKISTVYLLDEVGHPIEFVELLILLESSKEGDEIYFKLGTPGGRADTAIMLCDAFLHTKALLIGEVVGEIASAGTVLLMAMDNIRIAKHARVMIHYYSNNIQGKGNEIVDRVVFESEHYTYLFTELYRPFLTKSECQAVINGKDMFINAEDTTKRWGRVMKRRKKALHRLNKT